jgi:hypothetical protein
MKRLILLSLLFLPLLADAAPLVKFTPNVYQDCMGYSDYACYDRYTKTIWISDQTKPENFNYIFWHEYGHYLTLDMPYNVIAKQFKSDKPYESAADDFYWYMTIPEARTVEDILFWEPLLTTK